MPELSKVTVLMYTPANIVCKFELDQVLANP